jgi:hypothetical protein
VFNLALSAADDQINVQWAVHSLHVDLRAIPGTKKQDHVVVLLR